jgi:hypothetical protein
MTQYRNGEPYIPTCGESGPIPYRDDRGRSVRCGECLIVAVHPFGNTDAPYVHWTDLAPTGHPWRAYAVRNAANGRLIVPKGWRRLRPTA